ncbi:GGDEF domain-containing protein [Kineococcus esterisolvens]|uniref:GGDEF domain-containing protein n=1 Tax=unclassified Kineococcus TaxID=2621656 RepID=UPI003D7C5C6F
MPDVPAHPRASRAVVEACGTVSAVWQPVLLRGCEPVGVLAVVWRRPVRALAPGVAATLATLAGEAAHAVERADLMTRLERAAEHDALTGLPNRRRWDEVAASEVARAARTGAPLTFALLDLDLFKRYNDTLGHLAGDELLRDFAAAAAAQLREVDTLARWGGEEFVLALPGCDALGAVAVADRIRAVVPHGQSCTVGVAQWVPGWSPAQVLAAADAAMYRGKLAGRDATVAA